MEKHLLDKVSQFTLEQIYDELYEIKRDLNFLDETISLTKSQRELYNDINSRVRKLLGCR